MPATDPEDEKLGHQPPLRERVRERLERLIIDGVYQPGEHLVETDLANRLGVSRGPIREALHQLQLQGWVDLRPRHGAFVHQPSYGEVDQFFQVRELLEVETMTRAIEHATADDLNELREQVKTARRALAKKNEAAVIRANAEFHGRIHRLANNPVLLELVSLLDKRLRWYFAPVSMERAASAWDEHEELITAIEKGDRRRVAKVCRTHNNRTREAYLRHLRLLDESTADRSAAD